MLRGKRLLVTGIVAALLALAAVGAAFAQATPTPAGNGQAQTNYRQYFLDRLASALGITREQLNTAAKTAADQTIDKAQQDGKISQDRADKLKTQVDNSNGLVPWLGGRGPFGRPGPAVPRVAMIGGDVYLEGVAKALGMTVDDLKAQLKTGAKVADLAKQKGVSADQVKTDVLAAANARLDQAVANKRLTADQANKVKQALQNLPADRFLQLGAFGVHPGRNPKAPAGTGA